MIAFESHHDTKLVLLHWSYDVVCGMADTMRPIDRKTSVSSLCVERVFVPLSDTLLGFGSNTGEPHHKSERRIFSFDEELAYEQRLRQNAAPVYYITRGGASNMVDS